MRKFYLKLSPSLALKLRAAANPAKAAILQRFFKTGPGQYGEGDLFLGLDVPSVRRLAKENVGLKDVELIELLKSPWHEARLLGVIIMVNRYETARDEASKRKALSFYLRHRYALNNWDLVDLSVYKVWGDWLKEHPEDRKDLFVFADSGKLWERRMAVVATMALIKDGQFKEIIALSLRLLGDREDLMHKAIGWMLREMGKKDLEALRSFLAVYGRKLPRTALRYAIERFDERERKYYLNA